MSEIALAVIAATAVIAIELAAIIYLVFRLNRLQREYTALETEHHKTEYHEYRKADLRKVTTGI